MNPMRYDVRSAHGFAMMCAGWPKGKRPADMVSHGRYAGWGVAWACSKAVLWWHCAGNEEELARGRQTHAPVLTQRGQGVSQAWKQPATRSLPVVDGGGYGSARLNVGGPAHGERDGEAEAVCTDRGTTVKLANDGARLTEEDRGGGVSPGDEDPTRRQ
jgi:hypothetical protein